MAARRRWHIRLSPAAERDFVIIVEWTAKTFGVQQAQVYRETLLATLTALADGPDVAGARSRDDISPGLRTLHVSRAGRRSRHFAVYRTDGADMIEVVRIIHETMDVSPHVPSDN